MTSASAPGICVIGSAGFIGRNLCAKLSEPGFGMQLSTIDIEPHDESPRHVRQDISHDELLTNCGLQDPVDTIVNLAAAHRDDVKPFSRYFEVNVRGAELVCDLARRVGARRIVFTSSVAVYGFAPPNTDEHGAINPFNEYGRTKALAEDVYRAWFEEAPTERCLVIVRPTVVFGPGNRGNVYNLLRQVASGIFLMVGSGENVKSIAYVDNVVAFLLEVLRLGPGLHVYNYIDKPDLKMTELVQLVRSALGREPKRYLRVPRLVGSVLGWVGDAGSAILRRPLPISSIRMQKFCATTQFETSISVLGFVPPTELKAALVATVAAEFGDGVPLTDRSLQREKGPKA
jgi:nucleoside-diphosphate-sugar epimerase